MDDYYLDDIYMYGAAAKDIPYMKIQKAFPEITDKSQPTDIYNHILSDTKEKISTERPEYQTVHKKLTKLSHKAKFPIALFLLSIAALSAIFIIIAIARKASINFGTILAVVGGSALLAIWPAIFRLIYGASIRDRASFKDLERAYSSDLHVLSSGGLAIIKHCYNYPNYDTIINPKGQLIPLSAGFSFDYEQPVRDEIKQIENSYIPSNDSELPFSQAFIIKQIHDTKIEDDLLILTADCEIYSIIHPAIGTIMLDDGSTNEYSSHWYSCHHGAKNSVRLVLPAIDKSKIC